MANPINIDRINWHHKIAEVGDLPEDSCRRTGAELALAALHDVIVPRTLNTSLRKVSKLDSARRDAFIDGYLYRTVKITTRSKKKVEKTKPYFSRLFSKLDDDMLKFLLPSIDNDYVSDMMVGDTNLFLKCWSVIEELPQESFTRMQSLIHAHLATKKAGIKKAVHIASDAMLLMWLSDMIHPLFNADPKLVNKGETEYEVCQDCASRILPKDLPRLWKLMQEGLSDERLKGDQSLGHAFLEGLQHRKDAATPSVSQLIERVDHVVHEQFYQKKALDDLIDAIIDRWRFFTITEYSDTPLMPSFGIVKN